MVNITGQDNSETKQQEESSVLAEPVKMPVSAESTPCSSSPDQKPTSPQLVLRTIKGRNEKCLHILWVLY